jgi:hemolysin III
METQHTLTDEMPNACEIDSDAEIADETPRELRDEEPINTLTHGVGCLLSIAGVAWLAWLARAHGDRYQQIGVAIYGASLVAVYAASTLSHLFRRPRLRRLFRIIDQACIFLLIAGTFTPVSLTYLRTGYWWVLFGLIWAIALFGFFSKAIFAHRVESVSTVLHVALGWLPVSCLKPMIGLAPAGLFGWMLAGGICYTVGTIFLRRDERVPYFHAVWHLLVIAGSALHFWAIAAYCTG